MSFDNKVACPLYSQGAILGGVFGFGEGLIVNTTEQAFGIDMWWY